MANINTNISDYTLSELMAIVGLTDDINREQITENTKYFIDKYKNK